MLPSHTEGVIFRVTTQGERGQAHRRCLKPILITVIIAVPVYCIASLIAAYAICGMVFARYDESDVLSHDYVYLTDPPPRTRVQFASGKNTLTGYLYEADTPCGIILIAHGMHGNNNSHLSETLFFLSRHWSVFTFDGTGTGESTGTDTVGLEQMVADLRAAMAYIAETDATASLPLMLYGHSMGGYAAAIAAEDGNCLAVVSIAGFDSPMEVMLHNGRRYVGQVAVLGYPFLYLQNKLTFGENADKRAVDAINRSEASFLIVYGADDEVIPQEESIYGNRDEITNPAVTYLFIEDEPRDGHSAAWYSAEAMTYRQTLEEELNALADEYEGEIPSDVLTAFGEGIDRDVLFEPDEAFLSTVLQFYTKALE